MTDDRISYSSLLIVHRERDARLAGEAGKPQRG